MTLFLKKTHLLRCWNGLSVLNWVGALTLSQQLKLLPRKLLLWFVLWRSFLLRLLNISHGLAWNYCSFYLRMFDKLQKPIYMTVGPSLTAFLEPWAHRRNKASLRLFYRYYFGRFSFELAGLDFLVLVAGPLVILRSCMIFLTPFLNVTRTCMSRVSFLAHLYSGIVYQQNASFDLISKCGLWDFSK